VTVPLLVPEAAVTVEVLVDPLTGVPVNVYEVIDPPFSVFAVN
jgi:hypothetical protein